MNYRAVGAHGAYPGWLRALRGKSGAYVIRERGFFGSTVVYVGESKAGRLYETITRHFQTWKRSARGRKKLKWYQGGLEWLFGDAADPGRTYDRASCEVAFVVTAAGRSLAEQDRLIRRLRPRDNQIGKPADDDPPF